jgi:hypothetical protein
LSCRLFHILLFTVIWCAAFLIIIAKYDDF